MSNRNGVGRPNNPTFVTSWGESIEGAYKSEADNKLRPIGKSKPAYSLRDEARAVMKFRRWQQEQGNAPLEPLDSIGSSISGAWMVEQERERIRNLILTDPKQAAVELRIPHLAHYPETPDKPQFTLAGLGEHYLANKRNKQGKPLDAKHKKNSEKWWNDFVASVGVKYARDLTQPMIERYYDEVMGEFDADGNGNGKSAAYVKSRFVKVKAILNWGVQRTTDKTDCRAALDLCSILVAPEDDSDPCPITPEQFHTLLDKADARMKAILLLGLNCAMHSGEIGKTMKADIDLDARTLEGKRSKTRQRRAAWLWTRTVDAIREYQAKHPHKAKSLFVSRTGKDLTGESIRQLFVTLRKKAGLSDVKLEGLRDAAYTIANQTDSYYVKFLAGHTIKDESKKYVVRGDNPNVRACCEAIETHFFPSETTPKKKRGKK